MKKFFILHLFILIAIIVGVVIGINYAAIKLVQLEDSYIEYLGESVVIKQDTLEIVDYSLWKGSLTLENGKKIHTEYADKKLLKQKETQ